jgi:hypothetical protein
MCTPGKALAFTTGTENQRQMIMKKKLSVTKELLEVLRTKQGGYTKETLSILGIGKKRYLQGGWQRFVLGKRLPIQTHIDLLENLKKANQKRAKKVLFP